MTRRTLAKGVDERLLGRAEAKRERHRARAAYGPNCAAWEVL